MPSHCRTALNIVLTSLFAALVLLTILLAYVTGRLFETMNPISPVCPDFCSHLLHTLLHTPGVCWTDALATAEPPLAVATLARVTRSPPITFGPTLLLEGYQFIHTEQHHLSFGLYGALLSLHLFLQSLFAFLEHRQMRSLARPQHLSCSVALCIAAYQEDPDYLRKCLRSVRRISFPGLRVVLVVDGNRPEDRYMMDIFQEVMGGADHVGTMVWKGNYHSDGPAPSGEAERVVHLVRGYQYTCVMQEWGGKREVMYTAFKALGDSVDYVQVSPSPGARWSSPDTT